MYRDIGIQWRLVVLLGLSCVATSLAQEQVERLDRGLVVLPTEDGGHFASWRLLSTDPNSVVFNLFQVTADGTKQVGTFSDTDPTCYLVSPENAVAGAEYFLQAVSPGEAEEQSDMVPVWEHPYWEIPLQTIEGYRPGDASIADLDGDGQYEIVLHQVGRSHDNSHSGLTDNPILDAYEMDGTHLWRIDLGRNIRDGEHYTQFMVFDLDGDGCAEMACKTADGSTDGTGRVIGDASKDWRTLDEASRAFGRVLDGPEYLTVFDGKSGHALVTVDYAPDRYPIDGWGGIGGNGGNDNYGNRCDRFLACVAYLDGQRPSLVMCRGVYGRTVLVAWDYRDGELSQRWIFDSGISMPPFADASPFSGMGGHSLSVADVDDDGRDEIVYQAMVVDDDGRGLYSSGLRHGDSMHISDMDPDRPGLEVFSVQENEEQTTRFQTPGAALRDARTGELIWSHSPAVDVGAGLAADIDPRHRGYELWGGPGGLRTVKGEAIGRAPRTTGFALWWDADRLRELFDGRSVTKWDWRQQQELPVQRLDAGRSRYPCLTGDILGDWREEIIVPDPKGGTLRVYSTCIPTEHRLTTLMHNRQYRLSIAWQNVVYNKPPHPSFFLGEP